MEQAKNSCCISPSATLQFAFLRFPRFLFSDSYRGLSNDAKLLYCMLLDRTSLSIKNHWKDAEGHVYILFPRTEAADLLQVSIKTATKLFQELQEYALITKQHSGKCMADHIYVLAKEELSGAAKKERKSCAHEVEERPMEQDPVMVTPSYADRADTLELERKKIPAEREVITPPEGKKILPSYIQYNHTKLNKTHSSSIRSERKREGIDPLIPLQVQSFSSVPAFTTKQLSDQLEFDQLKRDCPQDAARYDDLFMVINDMIHHPRPLKVQGSYHTAKTVQEKYLRLTRGNLEGVLYTIDHRDPGEPIRNYQAYVETLLFHSVSVQHIAFEDYFHRTYHTERAC